jgi:hypothetical protein
VNNLQFKPYQGVNILMDFFDILQNARPEYSEAMEDVAKLIDYRKQTILFSSTTLRALAGATFKASAYYDVDRLTKIQDIFITG